MRMIAEIISRENSVKGPNRVSPLQNNFYFSANGEICPTFLEKNFRGRRIKFFCVSNKSHAGRNTVEHGRENFYPQTDG